MSYVDYDIHEKAGFYDVPRDACANCDRTDAILFDFHTDDDKHLRLCTECCAEERKQEQLADQLAAAPSCDRRQLVIDGASTTRGLVNALQAHDLSCAVCASTRKTVSEDRLYVAPGAVCCEGEAA